MQKQAKINYRESYCNLVTCCSFQSLLLHLQNNHISLSYHLFIILLFSMYKSLHVIVNRTTYIYTVSQKKLCQCYFVNNSVKH